MKKIAVYQTPAILAIIPAAGKARNQILQDSTLPDTMTPINGKPVIGYIIDDLLSRGIHHIAITISKKDTHTKNYVTKKYQKKCALYFVSNTKMQRGLGYSILIAYEAYKKSGQTAESVFVYLGDTIYKGPLSFSHSFLVSHPLFGDHKKWCIVETASQRSSKELIFINKPLQYNGNGSIVCGLYFFKKSALFEKALAQSEKEHEFIEMKDILEQYQKQDSFSLVPAEQWYDCGNLENYYRAKIDFLKIRSFNSLNYNTLYGTITKKSAQKEKMADEIAWYQTLPKELQIFAPRLLKSNHNSYTLEFYGYQSLADMFLFDTIELRVWEGILRKLFAITNVFREYKKNIPEASFHSVYYKKTQERFADYPKSQTWQKMLAVPTITINGTVYKNLPHFLPALKKHTDKLFNQKYVGILHGDLCLSNILFDHGSQLFKFIDPRGNFGKRSIYGDVRYDIAKLRHSLVSKYDFIVSDLFHLEAMQSERDDSFNFDFYHFSEEIHDQVGVLFNELLSHYGYKIKEIKFIEALLFLSMIPLHSENQNRQLAMYLTGIRLLNEIWA